MVKRQIMGILNVTPDSFSDGGRYDSTEKALEQAEKLIKEGADIIDIGGQSTRPGYQEVSSQAELERILPVVKELRKISDIPISVDTYFADVASNVLEFGATIINDVTGLNRPDMQEVVGHFKPSVIVMHDRDYEQDVLSDVKRFFYEKAEYCLKLGLKHEDICLDPGIGFNKSRDDDYQLVRHARDIRLPDFPVLFGVSRKRIIGNLTGIVQPQERDFGTVGACLYLLNEGVDIVRVHNVKALKAACATFFE